MSTAAPDSLPAETHDPGWLRWLGDWRTVWVATALFVAVGVEGISNARYMHDEALLSWHFAGMLRGAPIPGLFFQKLRPLLALFYAPIWGLGFRAYQLAHLLVGASAIPLVAATSRALGHRSFAIPALVIAASPLMLITAAAGHSNTDATVGIALGLFLLHVKDRPWASGAVLGAMVLVRSEVAPIIALIALERAWARDFRVLIGLSFVPIGYALLGVGYHHDALWVLHHPPTLTAPAPNTDWLDDGAWTTSLAESALALLCLSPAIGLALLIAPRALASGERGLAIGLAAFVLAIRGLPMVGLFNFDTAPRYLLVALVPAALLVGRFVETQRAPSRHPPWTPLAVLAALAVVGFASQADDPIRLALPAVAVWSLAFALPRLVDGARGRGLGIATWLTATVVSWPLWPPHTWLQTPPHVHAIEQWWRSNQTDGAAVITNDPLVRAWLDHRDIAGDPNRYHFVLGHDTAYELDRLFNHDVGQGEALVGAMQSAFYGRPISTDDPGLEPEHWPPGSIVIFTRDQRLAETLDVEDWLDHVDLAIDDAFVVGRIRSPEEAEEPPDPREPQEPQEPEG